MIVPRQQTNPVISQVIILQDGGAFMTKHKTELLSTESSFFYIFILGILMYLFTVDIHQVNYVKTF